jgi:asparagine synthase (glutamine-hydrolysing)
MFRYVAFAWNAGSRPQAQAAEAFGRRMASDGRRWQLVFSAAGVRVYCTGLRTRAIDVHPLTGNAGVVLGTVFERLAAGDDPPPTATFDMKQTARIIASKGRVLVDAYWGRYVAFLHDRHEQATAVVRSPTGELDCLSSVVRGVTVYFSALEDCPVLDSSRLSIDWDYVAAELSTFLPQTRQTGLKEVQRLLHGECLTMNRRVTGRQSYWLPVEFINAASIETPEIAARELRRTARACIAAWARCHESVLAMLSGGFDSSVVVSLLGEHAEKRRVTCVNYRNRYDPTTDEREYARLVASAKGYPLVEHENSDEVSLEAILRLSERKLSCQPIFAFPEPGWRRELARSHGASACFTGEGGDQLFFQNGAYYVCADFIRRRGIRPRAISIALDAARIEGGALWPALRAGVRDGLRKDPLSAVFANYRFSPLLREDATDSVRRAGLYVPDSLRTAGRLPPGKCWQAIGLSVHDELYGAYAEEGDPELVYPLMSQPLQELCFRIPTYVLTIGGRSRGLARRAFEADVPRPILNRRTKAFGYDSMQALIAKNRAFLRSFLMDGALVKERIVDAQKLERILSGDVTKGIGTAVDVMHAVLTEVWLRRWGSTRAASAAA